MRSFVSEKKDMAQRHTEIKEEAQRSGEMFDSFSV
jgi:hypothetical protein